MKIGILTLPLHTNYGGILQAYALQTVLERMGHEVVVFNPPRRIRLSLWKLPLVFIKRYIKKYILCKKNTRIFAEKYHQSIYPIISQHTQQFIDKYIHLYNVNSLNDIKKDDFDAIVVGSDQVWRPRYFMPMFVTGVEDAFLRFTKNWKMKRVAYAASFGTDDWEYTLKQTKECGELLRMFDAVSVREESAVKLCKDKFEVEAQHVLDPTMLLDKEDYIKLFESANTPKSPGTLLNYILDETPEKKEIIENIAKEKNLIPFRVNSKIENPDAPLEERIQPPVEQWLRGFYDAEFVVTDSFHACVFSILFNKPFLVIGNEGRGMARFQSLLKIFGLENRLVTKDSYPKLSITTTAPNVTQKRLELKNVSYAYLNNVKG